MEKTVKISTGEGGITKYLLKDGDLDPLFYLLIVVKTLLERCLFLLYILFHNDLVNKNSKA